MQHTDRKSSTPGGESSPPLTRVWIARHAETATPHLLHGAESDVELGEHGQRQAIVAAEWFRQFEPTVVVSSAMRRAVQTAQPIAARCGVPHEIYPELHERRVGPFSQRPIGEVEPVWQQTVQAWQAGQVDFAFPGMESFAAIQSRVVPAWERIIARHRGGRIVVIAHGVVTKVLLLSLLVEYTVADWTRLGRAVNLAVSELCCRNGRWQSGFLLEVPEPVRLLDEQRLLPRRSEA